MSFDITYEDDSPIGVEGGFADTGFHDVVTKNNPSQEIIFGRGLFNIADDDDGVKLPDVNDAARFRGVALRDQSIEEGFYPAKSAVAVIKKGRVHVNAEEALNEDDPVFIRINGKQQVQTITFDIDFVASNKINLKINGEPISEVTFDTDQATTMGLLDAAITAMEGVANVTTLGKVVTITSVQDVTLEITEIAVTEGADQAEGVVEEAVVGIPVAHRGRFRKSADGGTAIQLTVGVKWAQGVVAPGVAVLDINLP